MDCKYYYSFFFKKLAVACSLLITITILCVAGTWFTCTLILLTRWSTIWNHNITYLWYCWPCQSPFPSPYYLSYFPSLFHGFIILWCMPQQDMVYVVEKSNRNNLLDMADKRFNIVPVVHSVSPSRYHMLINMVDVLFAAPNHPEEVIFPLLLILCLNRHNLIFLYYKVCLGSFFP